MLVDFGLSKQGLGDNDSSTVCVIFLIRNDVFEATFCGTPQYTAPEILKGEPYTKAVDWWSLGLMVFEMIGGYSPFYTTDTAAMYGHILNAAITYPTQYFSPNAQDFLSHLLDRDPKMRYTPSLMKVHPTLFSFVKYGLEARLV